MTLFPAGIEVFKRQWTGGRVDTFSQARLVLHDKLARLADPKALFAIPQKDLFEQVDIVVSEILEHEAFELDMKEQQVLSRVLAFDLLESRGRTRLVSTMMN